ncbi:MAG TPA: flagellar hook assembly protein FlgD [Sedimenticola sp.]|nr:flagellar hook assembly protein FlgD [Sedimenticola sp.]
MSTIDTGNDIYQGLGLNRPSEESDSAELTQEDFMSLLVTELTHQDPFKPMDNTELASQISQFSVVSGIDQLNTSFSSLSDSLVSDQALQAAGLVGREVLVASDVGYLAAGRSIDGVVGLDTSASSLNIAVYEQGSDRLVREIELGTRPAGEVAFSWDGLMDNGEYAPPGRYRIQPRAMVDGEETAPYLLTEARVGSVSVGAPGQGLALNLDGLGVVSFNDVAEIH